MSDLIDRQAAMDAVDVDNLHRGIVEALQNIISELPSAEPERKAGRWLVEYLDGIPGRRAEIKYCSECCQVSPYRYNFCPNCGADMRGEREPQ